MGSLDALPSLVSDMRAMKSRIAELERQQLGAAKQAADAANQAVDVLSKTVVARATPTTSDPVAPGNPGGLMPEMSIDLDPMGYPVIVFFSCAIVNPGNQPVQVAANLVVGGSTVGEAGRAVNVQSNFDQEQVAWACALSDPFWTAPGVKNYSIRWVITSLPDPAQPRPYTSGTNRNFAALRIGTL